MSNAWSGRNYLETRRLILSPPYGQIVERLHYYLTTGVHAYRWRFRGATPAPQVFAQQMWDGILCQYACLEKESGDLLGYVGLYNPNFISETVYCFAISFDDDPVPSRIGTGAEGLLALLFHGFSSWGFRKVYFEVPEFNLRSIGPSVSRHLREEGRLIQHERLDGRLWDSSILALTGEKWAEVAPRYETFVYGTESSHAS